MNKTESNVIALLSYHFRPIRGGNHFLKGNKSSELALIYHFINNNKKGYFQKAEPVVEMFHKTFNC